MVARTDRKVFGVSAKGLDLGMGPPCGMGGVMKLMACPFLPEKVLPFNLESRREVPGQPTFHLCHRVIQEMSFLRPNCILEIGSREEKTREDVGSEADEMSGVRVSSEIGSDPVANAFRRGFSIPLA